MITTTIKEARHAARLSRSGSFGFYVDNWEKRVHEYPTPLGQWKKLVMDLPNSEARVEEASFALASNIPQNAFLDRIAVSIILEEIPHLKTRKEKEDAAGNALHAAFQSCTQETALQVATIYAQMKGLTVEQCAGLEDTVFDGRTHFAGAGAQMTMLDFYIRNPARPSRGRNPAKTSDSKIAL